MGLKFIRFLKLLPLPKANADASGPHRQDGSSWAEAPSFLKNQLALKTYLDCLPFPKANADASGPQRQDVSSWAETPSFPKNQVALKTYLDCLPCCLLSTCLSKYLFKIPIRPWMICHFTQSHSRNSGFPTQQSRLY